MKTRHIPGGLLMAAAALLCLAGCKKDDEGEKITLGTQFEKATSNQKTYLGDDNVLCWSANDSVFVNGVKYKGISSEGIEVTEDEHYYAVYPATTGNSVDANGGTVEIPASQIFHTENGKQVIDGPMAARLDAAEGTLHFKNLYSLLKVTVSADDKDFTVNTITVTATGDNARALAGSYTFTFNGATTEDATSAPAVNPYAETLKDSSTKVSLACVSVQVSANSDKDFYLAVHPLVGQNLKVEVQGMLDGKSAIYTHTTATTVGLSRSRIGGLGINLQQLNPVMGIGFFSVAADRSVIFSPGNLQYRASTNTWRFAEHQWDYVGDAKNGTVNAGSVKCDNASISSTYTGWIDLFGWGTSGWNNGNTYYRPYDNSQSGSSSSVGYGYGPTNGSTYTFDLTGTYANADWGVFNQIGSDPAGTWRTLTNEEWAYLLGVNGNGRSNGHSDWWIFNMVKITDGEAKDVQGAIIYPDGITAPPAGLSVTLTKESDTANITIANITTDDFAKLEAAGCVFLPAAGYRTNNNTIKNVGNFCSYWSSTHSGAGAAHNCYFNFYNKKVNPSNINNRYDGRSIRLVKNVE